MKWFLSKVITSQFLTYFFIPKENFSIKQNSSLNFDKQTKKRFVGYFYAKYSCVKIQLAHLSWG